ncbi:MAG: tetratricopeptide repeat protein [bacterium]
MNRVVLVAAFILVSASLAVVTGCKDSAPTTELERFIIETNKVAPEALTDTLRSHIRADGSYAVYASYLMGNHFYGAAQETAMTVGWTDGTVNALLDSAELYFTAAVERDSTFLEALVNLGSLWDDRSEQMGSRTERDDRLAKAEMYYRKALEVDPLDEKARCNLGALYLRMRRTSDALAEFQTVLANDPRSSLAHYNLAIMFAEAKIYREAISEWELASKYDPDGDIGDRSRDNIKIVHDLMNAPTPDNVK